MTTIQNLHEVVTASGNVLRGVVEVGGTEFRIETDLEKTHIQILNPNSNCETGDIDDFGDIVAQGGECVTQEWHSEEWTALKDFIGYV